MSGTARTARTLPPERPRDAGQSLVEILVAMGLLGLLTTMIATVAILGLRTTDGTQARLDDAVQGELGILAVSKVLRTAVLPDQLDDQVCDGCADTAVVSASGTDLTFYANLDNTGQGPSLVTLSVVEDPDHPGTALLREVSQPPQPLGEGRYTFCDRASAGCVVRTRTMARGLLWPPRPSFAYYDFAGSAMPGSARTRDELARISSVDVVVPVRSESGIPVTTALQRVRLPNADINVLVQPS